MTTWKPIGFGWGDLYEVSSDGFVRRIGTSRNLGVKSRGYVRVHFSRDGVAKIFSVHKIVADAFIGPKPPGLDHIDHINGVRHDNRVENLRYCTPLQNHRFTIERGAFPSGSKHGKAMLTDEQVLLIRRLKAERGRYWGAAEIAKELGVSRGVVGHVVRNRSYPASSIRSNHDLDHEA